MAEFEGCDLEMAKIETLVAADYTEKVQRRHSLDAMLKCHGQMSEKMDALQIANPNIYH